MTTTDLPWVVIRWTDAQGDAYGWTPINELDDTPCVVTTVGQLLEGARQNHYTVALSTYGGDGEVRHVDSLVHIPAGMVHSMTTLRI